MSECSVDAVQSLPLVTLHLTERCNSRCASCDYWRNGRRDVSLASVASLLPELRALGTRSIMITGGEPLIHPQWPDIVDLLQRNGIRLWLHTSGLSLAKHAARVAAAFDSVTVSLDGIDRDMYAATRGVDAFDHVCTGIRALTELTPRVNVRTTLQRANYFALPQFIELARALRVAQISFLAADVSSGHAFGRTGGAISPIALQPADLSRFAAILANVYRDYAQDFATGFIAERPAKLQRLLDYYRALAGLAEFPAVRCNAPEFSAVLTADGRVHPCFFIAGPAEPTAKGIKDALNSPAMSSLRTAIRHRQRIECTRCVCSLWRDPGNVRDLMLGSGVAA